MMDLIRCRAASYFTYPPDHDLVLDKTLCRCAGMQSRRRDQVGGYSKLAQRIRWVNVQARISSSINRR